MEVTEQKPVIIGENAISVETPYKQPVIKKKRQFAIFKRLIKSGKFTTAYITAKALHVEPTTILQWLEYPQIRKLMNDEVEQYVSKISASKDWKAQAYLLDKVTDDDKSNTAMNNLIGLSIVINK